MSWLSILFVVEATVVFSFWMLVMGLFLLDIYRALKDDYKRGA